MTTEQVAAFYWQIIPNLNLCKHSPDNDFLMKSFKEKLQNIHILKRIIYTQNIVQDSQSPPKNNKMSFWATADVVDDLFQEALLCFLGRAACDAFYD